MKTKHTASEASAKKKQGALRLDPPKRQADPAKQRLLGFRALDGNEDHFPIVSLLMPEEAMARRWAAERILSGQHPDCGFLIEQLVFDLTTYHVLSRCGQLPDDPLVGAIDWQEAEPYDLGPLWEQMTVEEMQKLKDMPPAALEAAKRALLQVQPIYAKGEAEAKAETKANGKPETKANGETAKNGKPADKKSNGKPVSKPAADAPAASSIGSSHPAPKPGSAEKSAKGRGGAKSAPGHRAPSHRLRTMSKAKHTKRA